MIIIIIIIIIIMVETVVVIYRPPGSRFFLCGDIKRSSSLEPNLSMHTVTSGGRGMPMSTPAAENFIRGLIDFRSSRMLFWTVTVSSVASIILMMPRWAEVCCREVRTFPFSPFISFFLVVLSPYVAARQTNFDPALVTSRVGEKSLMMASRPSMCDGSAAWTRADSWAYSHKRVCM